jgi:hypothetical protein
MPLWAALLRLVAAGEGVVKLVYSVLHGSFGLVNSPLVLEMSVSGQRTGRFLCATLRFVDVRVGPGGGVVDRLLVSVFFGALRGRPPPATPPAAPHATSHGRWSACRSLGLGAMTAAWRLDGRAGPPEARI